MRLIPFVAVFASGCFTFPWATNFEIETDLPEMDLDCDSLFEDQSGANGDVVFVDVHATKSPGAADFLTELERRVSAAVPTRPHWGKEFRTVAAALRPAYLRFTSGTTSGTSGSIRQAEELSITSAPCDATCSAMASEVVLPAENSAMSRPV